MAAKYEGPRVARAGETRQLFNLLNRIFADGCPAGMDREYPHLYGDMERHLDYCHVIAFRGRIVAHVGVYPLEFAVKDRRIMAGGIGAVCTDERHRGKGLMSDLLGHCIEWMRGRGMPISILWGDAVRYGRFGWRVAGSHVCIGLQRRSLPALDRYRAKVVRVDGKQGIVDELFALHEKLEFRVVRNRTVFGLIMKKIGRRIYAVKTGKRISAYCLVRVQDESRRRASYTVEEWAGSGAGILSVLRSLLSSVPRAHVDICLPGVRLGWWTDLLKGADSWGLSIRPLGQVNVIDPDAALKALGMWEIAPLVRKSGPARRGNLAPLLFGPLSPKAHLPGESADRLVSVLPVPLFLFHSDHV